MRSQSILAALAVFSTSVVLAQTTTDGGLPPISTSTTSTTTSSSTTSASTGTSLPDATSSTGLPKISASGSYSYPAPTVPPTNNAPYMKASAMPQGTVFIAVGAILGAFAVAVLVWRAVTGCLLDRSVKRAALAQHLANDKASNNPAGSSTPFYKYKDNVSTASIGKAGRGTRRTQRGPIPSSTPSQSNLFFSPTAPGSAAGNAGNRESRFLPSGFYAAAAQHGHEHSISLTNLSPEPRGHRNMDRTPPDSPALGPRHDMSRRNMSSSTLNLNRPPSSRAPSAYLEDLLADQPEHFPPPGLRNNQRDSSRY
ncbi:hypothetical protein F5Y16DRAFT_390477 [Xylariaceae sp. FL0255]|nr:hypothetical protein F5Y16DRAFT_390477 [Xylariaceae sp. FL0255]